MNAQELIDAGIPLSGTDAMSALHAEAALDWMTDNTTLLFDKADIASIEALPACAKLFVVKFSEVAGMREGVSSQSIEGLSLSFNSTDKSEVVMQLARTYIGAYLRSQVRVYPARRRW